MDPLPRDAALVVIDVQEGFDDPAWGRRNNPHAEENVAHLLAAWRHEQRPIFHVQHASRHASSPLAEASPGVNIKEAVRPVADEPLVRKRVHSAFIGTDLEVLLRDRGCSAAVVTGLTTNRCVETITRMAANLGFETYLVSDATATFDRRGPHGHPRPAEEIHTMTLTNLAGEFATVLATHERLALLVPESEALARP